MDPDSSWKPKQDTDRLLKASEQPCHLNLREGAEKHGDLVFQEQQGLYIGKLHHDSQAKMHQIRKSTKQGVHLNLELAR